MTDKRRRGMSRMPRLTFTIGCFLGGLLVCANINLPVYTPLILAVITLAHISIEVKLESKRRKANGG